MKGNFIDSAKAYFQSGKGGSGCVSFRREKFVEFGGPDGGNGGKGGDIIFQVDENLNTLVNFCYQKHYKASNGERGMGRCCFGKNAEDMIVKVPLGTVVIDDETGHQLIELNFPGQSETILKGGSGGVGNSFFKTSTNRAPRKATPGGDGIGKWLRLELKLLANVGLIGKPNVGKSSFITKSTNYNAKIANYAFTTLKPSLGVIEINPEIGQSLVIADLPGLIEGAAQGKGLGLNFLKHAEKCEILLHIIDVAGKNYDQIIYDYQMIWKELKSYSALFDNKFEIVAFNKIDLCVEQSKIKEFQRQFEQDFLKKVFLISTYTGENIQKLNYQLYDIFSQQKQLKDKLMQKKVYFPSSGYKK